MARETTVLLGGGEYTLKAVPIREAKIWRAKLGEPFSAIMSVLSAAGEIKITSAEGLGQLFQVVQGVLIGAPEMILDLLCEYCPEIAAAREEIEEIAYDEEVFEVFLEAIKLVYPFGVFRQVMGPAKPKPVTRRGHRKGTS